jgi:hypothetical protein
VEWTDPQHTQINAVEESLLRRRSGLRDFESVARVLKQNSQSITPRTITGSILRVF